MIPQQKTDSSNPGSPFGKARSILDSCISEPFDKLDGEAIRQQKRHRTLTVIAAFAGTLAVILAVLQLTIRVIDPENLEPFKAFIAYLESTKDVAILESGVILLALIAVVIGISAAHKGNWILSRSKAERIRMLKFRALLQPDLWVSLSTDRSLEMEEWRLIVNREILNIKAMKFESLHAWMAAEKISPSPQAPDIPPGRQNQIDRLIEYYTINRLDDQIGYFTRAAERLERRNLHTERIPDLLFFASVFCVLLHFSIEALVPQYENNTGFYMLSIGLIFAAISLPVILAGIRTYRGAHEFSRSSLLFRTKANSLAQMRKRLDLLRSADPPRYDEIYPTLLEAEDFFESEHREWLRLMMETEWY